MSKITFCADNKLLRANLSIISGTEDAQFPLSNIKHNFTTKVFRSTGNTVTILVDLLQSSECDIVCIKGSSIDGIGFNSCTIEGSATTVFSGTPINIDLNSTYNFGYKQFTATSNRYWKLVFSGDSFVEVSNIYIGKKTQLMENNLSIGFQYNRNTNNSVSKNVYGQRFINNYNTIDTLSGSINYVNSVEFDQLNSIHVQNGESNPIWFLLDPDNSMSITDSSFLFSGFFYMKDLVWKNIAPSLYDVTITLEEAI